MMRAPPPKMRELAPPPKLGPPANLYRGSVLETSIVRQVEPEDVYDDRNSDSSYERSYLRQESHRAMRAAYPQAPPPRQISNTSTAISGSENWETYDDNSEPEPDASDAYYAKVRAARNKRFTPDDEYSRPHASQAKRLRAVPPPMHSGIGMVDAEGNRTISGSEWTDEDAF